MTKTLKCSLSLILSVCLLFCLSACSSNKINTDPYNTDAQPSVPSPQEKEEKQKAEFLEKLDLVFQEIAPSFSSDPVGYEWCKNDITNRLLERKAYKFSESKQGELIIEEFYIMIARSCYLVDEPTIYFGDAFDYFFSNAKWETFEGTRDDSDELVRIVEFTGGFLYDNSPANALIQFEIDEDGNCDYSFYSRDGNPETMRSLDYLIEDVIDTYKLYKNKATPAN